MINRVYIYDWGKSISFKEYVFKLVKIGLGNFSREVWTSYKQKNKIKLKECIKCSISDVKIFAHHTDYSMPLLVTPLCGKCHSFYHKQVQNEYGNLDKVFDLMSPDEIVGLLERGSKKDFFHSLLNKMNDSYLRFEIFKPTNKFFVDHDKESV